MESIESDEKRIFHAALEAADDAARADLLARECGADAALRARVEALLAAHVRAGAFLEPRAGLVRAAEQAGQTIGRYRLLQQIGEGGFGSVWMAEQREPVKRRVALKIIKLGMDTKQVIARFDAERQALAMMDHPNIAKVLDAGATETGRPFFVMELVKGVSLLEYCDSEKLDTHQRLELFVAVCQAIQHAHQKGVIHRDVKPSNVLVTLHDGVAVPKVIDFGIAKATHGELTAKTLFTEHRQMIGTPAYMSPEQAEMSGLDIDTRADIYSLGVLLYELLTGTTPFDTKALVAKGFAEMMRVIREVEPHRPSTRISTLGETALRTAGQRRCDVKKLGLLLRGDLDWIVMKCLEKDRSRRYQTASGLASDIRRHLSDEPVIAGPPSRAYRMHKFVRRNRAAVLSGGALVLTLIAGVVGVGLTTFLAEQEKARVLAIAARENEQTARAAAAAAQRAEAEARRALAAEAEAQRRSAELEAVARFQESQLASIDLERMGADLRRDLLAELRTALERAGADEGAIAREEERVAASVARVNWTNVALKTLDANIFARAVATVDRDFEGQPLVRARLLHTLADTLRNLGLLEAARGPQERALEIRRTKLGEAHADTLSTLASASVLLQALGELEAAETLSRDGLADARHALGDDHETTIALLNNLGSLQQDRGKVAEAEALYREALERSRRVLGDEDPSTISLLNNLGSLMQDLGRLDDAAPFTREALALSRRTLGEDHPDTLATLHNLGALLRKQEKLDEAEPVYREAVDRSRRRLGDEHPDTLASLHALGMVLFARDRVADADGPLREALAGYRRVLGEDHLDTIIALNGVALLLKRQDEWSEAEPLFREALERARRTLGDDHASISTLLFNLGDVLDEMGRATEAEPLLRESIVRRRRESQGDDDFDVLKPRCTLGHVLYVQGRLAEAEAELRDVLERGRRLLGESHYLTGSALRRLLAVLHAAHKHAESEPFLRENLALVRARSPLDESELADALANLALSLMAQQRLAEAETLLRECVAIRRTATADAWLFYNAQSLLGATLAGQGKHDEAQQNLREAFEKMEPPAEHAHHKREALERLIDALRTAGELEDAARYESVLATMTAGR